MPSVLGSPRPSFYPEVVLNSAGGGLINASHGFGSPEELQPDDNHLGSGSLSPFRGLGCPPSAPR
eukprot:5244148-Pyramimonas_sp.AAC.1